MKILSFDVGIVHLGVVLIQVDDDDQELISAQVVTALCVNISKIQHQKISRKDCTLYHSKEIVDKMNHFFQEYKYLWTGDNDDVQYICIEKQPPCGITSVETMLHYHFRDKLKIIYPVQMHKWLGISDFDYEQRKNRVVSLADDWLKNQSDFKTMERKHDMADALMLGLFFIYKNRQEEQKKRKKRKFHHVHQKTSSMKDPIIFFEQYRFHPS